MRHEDDRTRATRIAELGHDVVGLAARQDTAHQPTVAFELVDDRSCRERRHDGGD
jgi:hypothetical protein